MHPKNKLNENSCHDRTRVRVTIAAHGNSRVSRVEYV